MKHWKSVSCSAQEVGPEVRGVDVVFRDLKLVHSFPGFLSSCEREEGFCGEDPAAPEVDS
jgi:hypothetical protein